MKDSTGRYMSLLLTKFYEKKIAYLLKIQREWQ